MRSSAIKYSLYRLSRHISIDSHAYHLLFEWKKVRATFQGVQGTDLIAHLTQLSSNCTKHPSYHLMSLCLLFSPFNSASMIVFGIYDHRHLLIKRSKQPKRQMDDKSCGRNYIPFEYFQSLVVE